MLRGNHFYLLIHLPEFPDHSPSTAKLSSAFAILGRYGPPLLRMSVGVQGHHCCGINPGFLGSGGVLSSSLDSGSTISCFLLMSLMLRIVPRTSQMKKTPIDMIIVVEIRPKESHLKMLTLYWMFCVVRFSFLRVSQCSRWNVCKYSRRGIRSIILVAFFFIFSSVVGKKDLIDMMVSRLTYSSPSMYTVQFEIWIRKDPT